MFLHIYDEANILLPGVATVLIQLVFKYQQLTFTSLIKDQQRNASIAIKLSDTLQRCLSGLIRIEDKRIKVWGESYGASVSDRLRNVLSFLKVIRITHLLYTQNFVLRGYIRAYSKEYFLLIL